MEVSEKRMITWFTTSHHPPKLDVIPKPFLQIILAAEWLVWHSSMSPKQHWRSLPLLYFCLFLLLWGNYLFFSTLTIIIEQTDWRAICDQEEEVDDGEEEEEEFQLFLVEERLTVAHRPNSQERQSHTTNMATIIIKSLIDKRKTKNTTGTYR